MQHYFHWVAFSVIKLCFLTLPGFYDPPKSEENRTFYRLLCIKKVIRNTQIKSWNHAKTHDYPLIHSDRFILLLFFNWKNHHRHDKPRKLLELSQAKQFFQHLPPDAAFADVESDTWRAVQEAVFAFSQECSTVARFLEYVPRSEASSSRKRRRPEH